VVCKSRKEALRRRAELIKKMGLSDDNAPKPVPEKENPPKKEVK
jgi:hypothetical protein